jgi:DNA/RNA-binding domain of Phe-tRNA-synthetase-like protein
VNPVIEISESCKTAYPGACFGFLALDGVANPPAHAGLDERKLVLEADLRLRFAGQGRDDLRRLPVMPPYEAYYGSFKKTYHVLLQLESVALKGKSLPGVAALVEAMFMAELENGLLTAGHDRAALQGPVRVNVAAGTETYTLLNGKDEALKPGDMYMADDAGVISSILSGPDRRTRLVPGTHAALFAVYAPPGIGPEPVHRHLETIRDNVRIISPEAIVGGLEVYAAA